MNFLCRIVVLESIPRTEDCGAAKVPNECLPGYAQNVGRFLILAGVALVFLGLVVIGADRIGIHLGRLPRDIRVEGRRGGFYFPVVTCILLSVLLSLISWLFTRR